MIKNKNELTLGSLFDGSGGFPLAGILAGVTPLWASEIEPFAVRVTTARLPQMKHYGDVSGISGADLPPVDIITFGSPCQDMSIAGKRDGLDGSRSSLFYEADPDRERNEGEDQWRETKIYLLGECPRRFLQQQRRRFQGGP